MNLMARMRKVRDVLHRQLPYDYPRQLRIVKKASAGIRGFEALLFPDFVGRYGLGHFDRSLDALEFFTPLGSSEFGVRPFLLSDPQRTLKRMLVWAQHEDPQVRRLASEGCRPRLPWAPALPLFKKDPTPVLPILRTLKADPSEYVRRSVANHLNDIAKDHPDIALSLAREWLGTSPLTDWIVRHGCRTLLKAAHPDALALFGYGGRVTAAVRELKLSKQKVRIGEALGFSFTLEVKGRKPTRFRMEYAVYFMKANGKPVKKIFQIAEKDFPSGDTTISRTHRFHDLTTRKHHPGEHVVAVILNGREQARLTVILGPKVEKTLDPPTGVS